MTNIDIIAMAHEAGFKEHNGMIYVTTINDDCAKELERFAELIRADERNSWPAEMEAMERQVNILTDALAQSRKPLPVDEIAEIADRHLDVGDGSYATHYVFGETEFARAIEAAHGIKEQQMICDECETVAHCMKNGCVPKTTKKDEALRLALEALTHGCPPDCKDGMTDSGGIHPWGEAALVPCPNCEALTALREALAEQPAPVAEPLFKPLIDLHPGLAEELKAMDTAQQEPVAWFKHGPYEDGELLSVVFEDPNDDVCYSPLGFIDSSPQPRKQEPVALDAVYAAWHGAGIDISGGNWSRFVEMLPPLYTSPSTLSLAQRPWVGLTDEEVKEIWDAFCSPASGNIVRNIEAKLKEKNSD